MNDSELKQFPPACRDRQIRDAEIDEVLYDLFKSRPDHSIFSKVYVKVTFLNDAYTTRIQRQIVKRDGQGSAMQRLTNYILENGRKIDRIFEQIKGIKELTKPNLEEIVIQHGRFVDLLKPLMKKSQSGERLSVRSFVSKYMHFHNSAVPVYDSNAYHKATNLVPWRKCARLFQQLPTGVETKFVRWNSSIRLFQQLLVDVDGDYYEFVCRFWQIYSEIRKAYPNATVKEVDYFLLFL